MSVDFRIPSVIEIRSSFCATVESRLQRYGHGGCRCFGGPLGSLGIASPPRSTGVDGGLGGASRLYASICVEPDSVPPGVSLR
uniref:Uncharacterized protein n=1 Tax=Chromera velia CCMP2878 TaxID=1169474 RepID=A0A0G4I2S5_9ALVE|eukprot:Cvel_10455.t1-p1 / transcript=Cvel_10455.t1 / gene=Cvel_10455 / organism=Chromera_velia_CCMP2878 / gene_product=hypothetical protein / transcript_product=hypothetical protein / location=Cvel_scaffold629:71860-73908(-) / protein_length=82 / sequence_SO=supercontig / SO=protein_coding / is_pseudo=false